MAQEGGTSRSRSIRTFTPKTLDEHVEAWHHWGRVAEGALWGRAAIAYSCRETLHAAGVEAFAETVKQTPARVYQLAQVFAAFPGDSNRFESLSFTHHQLAAASQEPAEVLELAQRDGWSTAALRAYLNPKAPAPAKPSSADSLVDAAARQQDGAAPVDDTFDVKAAAERMRRDVQRCPAVELERLSEAHRFALDRIGDRLIRAAS